jgi:hypothetical protein
MRLAQLDAWQSCLLCLLLFSLRSIHASKFISNPAARLSPEQRGLIEQLWGPELALSENLLRNGLKHEIPDARNWARLVEKLATDGSTVTIVAFGGSVTVGYKQSNTSYPEEFVSWLQDVFPNINFKLINLARRATAATFAALCLVQNMPDNPDLILLEYSINGKLWEQQQMQQVLLVEAQVQLPKNTSRHEQLFIGVMLSAPAVNI